MWKRGMSIFFLLPDFPVLFFLSYCEGLFSRALGLPDEFMYMYISFSFFYPLYRYVVW